MSACSGDFWFGVYGGAIVVGFPLACAIVVLLSEIRWAKRNCR